MSETSPDTRNEHRLYQLRWIILACAVMFAAFAWMEPSRVWFAVLGFAAVVAVAFVVPRRSFNPGAANLQTRQLAWPDTSTKSMAEALGYPVYIIDAHAVLRYANRAAETAFGPARAGDPLSYKFRRPEIIRLIEQVTETDQRAAFEYEEKVPHERWYAASVAPIPSPAAGKPHFYILSFVDLTEAKRAEQMRSDFVANASHELRTPLASLRGFIETIQGPAADDPEAQKRFLGLMLEQAERMSRMIDDLLSLSRIEMKLHVRPEDTVDLSNVMRHVANALAPLAKDLKVDLSLEVPEAPIMVRGDRDELIQVVENLVENACKYGQSGRKVDLSATLKKDANEGPAVEIVVRDYGQGISAEHLPRLTERFYRVDIASSREKQGTGLGLAIVKHILNRHGARLGVNSKLGEGAEFSFRLPTIK